MKTTYVCFAFLLFSVPSFGQITKFASPATDVGDRFGGRAAIHGDIAIIGAHVANGWDGTESGAAYLFDMTSGQELVSLDPCDGATFDRFGSSVAISSTRAIGGAPFADGIGGTNSGKAYIFQVPGGACMHSLQASDAAASDFFGSEVAVSDTYAVVGAASSDSNGQESGAAYVFDASTGQELFKLLPADIGPFISFGSSVAIHGGIIAVGARSGHGVNAYSGAVYLFDASTGAERAKLIAPDGHTSDRFGATLALHGTRLVVGAPSDADTGPYGGSAYLFDLATGSLVTKLLALDGTAGDHFGSALTTDGVRIAIGAYGDEGLRGSSYLFDASTGTYLTKHQAADGQALDQFGSAVALYGENLLIGASDEDSLGLNAGTAYLFRVSGPTEHSGKALCFGDGSGATCPCGSSGSVGVGCLNSSGVGARLTGLGNASVTFDSFQMDVVGVPPGNLGLLLQGNLAINGGVGNPAGDGVLCVAGNAYRSQVEIATGGHVSFANFQGQPFGALSYLSGASTNYQYWYRDPMGACSGSRFNFSNAWSVKWLP